MISAKQLRKIRRACLTSTGVFDDGLAASAQRATQANRPYYGTIQNPTTQDIYRYLCNFVATTADEQFQRERKQIKILDWGGGKGYAAYFLQEQGFDVTLYETTDFPHRDFWKEYKLDFKTSSDGMLPFDDKSFDIIVGFGVLEHVPYEYDALKELNRVLKDDGLLLCFNLPSRFGYLHHVAARRGVQYHDRLYAVRETRNLLKRTGFNIIGKPWRRQLFPKNSVTYKQWANWERLDLALCRYTPLYFIATSLEFVARKQYTYTSIH